MFKGLGQALFVTITLLLAACGGGGGGSAAPAAGGATPAFACEGASSSTGTADFSLSTVTVSLTGTAGVYGGSAQTVSMSVSNPSVYMVYITQQVTWLNISTNMSGGYATVNANAYSLAAGTYCTVVNVAVRNAAGVTLSSRNVAVQLVVAGSSSSSSSASSKASSAQSSSSSSSLQSSSSVASSASSSAASSVPGTGTAACSAGSAVPVSAATNGSKIDLNLEHNGLVYDKGRNVFYASIPSSVIGTGNRIASIDAATGAITYSAAAVGSNPAALAISADCSTLYVGLDGSGELLRLALPSMKEDGRSSLFIDSFFGKTRAESISVSPASADVVAVSQAYAGVSPRHAGVALFRYMVKQPKQTQTHTGSNEIGFDSTGAFLFGYNNETTEFGLRKIAVLTDGLSESSVVATGAGFSASIDVSAGLIMVGGSGYSASLASLGSVANGYACRKLPEVAKVVCNTSTAGTLSVADTTAFTMLAQPSSGADTYFNTVLPGPKGLVAQRNGSFIRLFRNDNFK